MTDKQFFPTIITAMPAADIPVEGVSSFLFQAERHQFVFMSFGHDVQILEHAHEAQWGVVLEGVIELTIDGQTRTLTRGDTYYIPRGIPHGAKIRAGYKDLTLFDQKDRYSSK